MNPTNYNALTTEDLHYQLELEGYTLRWNAVDRLELIEYSGGYRTMRPYKETPTGESFESVEEAHRYVFTL